MKKELRIYELVLLFKINNTEQETTALIEEYRNFLTEKGSQVMIKNRGKTSLAYPIKDFDTAMDVQFIYLGNNDLIKELNVKIQRDTNVLRAITTKLLDQNLPETFLSVA